MGINLDSTPQVHEVDESSLALYVAILIGIQGLYLVTCFYI